jgi:serine/threonine-protein kinase SRPK3
VHDRHTDGLAALKIQKSATHYTEAARDEIDMLTEIRDGDIADSKCCCRLLDTFEHLGPHGRHVCMVFEVLGDNLLALIKHYRYQGIPTDIVRNIARQVLIGLDYLHTCAPLFPTPARMLVNSHAVQPGRTLRSASRLEK